MPPPLPQSHLGMMIAPPAPEAPNVKAQHEMPGFRH